MKHKKKENKNKIIIVLIVIILILVFYIIRDKRKAMYIVTIQEEEGITTLETDENGMIKEPKAPTKDGYIFVGWYIGEEKVDFSKPLPENANIVAKWEKIEEQEEPSKLPDPETENSNAELSVEWVKVPGTAIEQARIYIKNVEGEYVSGTLELKTIAGDTFEEKVTPNGSENVYIKSAIESVKIK